MRHSASMIWPVGGQDTYTPSYLIRLKGYTVWNICVCNTPSLSQIVFRWNDRYIFMSFTMYWWQIKPSAVNCLLLFGSHHFSSNIPIRCFETITQWRLDRNSSVLFLPTSYTKTVAAFYLVVCSDIRWTHLIISLSNNQINAYLKCKNIRNN